MHADMPRRRVLVAAGASAVFSLRNLFSDPLMMKWQAVEADNLTRARFVMQHHPCEIVLLHDDVFAREGEQALGWLTHGGQVPVVVLAGDKGPMMAQALGQGADICLPRELVTTCPTVLAAALDRAACLGEKYRGVQRVHNQLGQCRRHLDRLVNILWRTTPMGGEAGWGTQRYALERLQEEVSRTQRHGGALTVALGEVQRGNEGTVQEAIAEWTSDVIAKAKRRCDVAGQYGLRGFLLLMVLTPKTGGVICCRRLQRLVKSAGDKGARGPVRAAFGVASRSAEADTPQALLRVAEQNLERAKTGANDGVVAE